MTKNKINLEMAEAEFNKFCDSMYFDIDETAMSEDELKSFKDNKFKIVKAISNGSLIITDTGEPIYTPVKSKDKTPITFYEMTGADLMATDKAKDTESVRKLYSIMQSITKMPVGHFSKLSYSPDLKVCMAIATLFLAG